MLYLNGIFNAVNLYKILQVWVRQEKMNIVAFLCVFILSFIKRSVAIHMCLWGLDSQ